MIVRTVLTHSMAIGNLNKSKESKPTTTTVLKQGPLNTDGRNSNKMVFFKISLGRTKDDLSISKVMKILLPNSNDINFRS
jgi:hypothetical protein